MAKIDLSKVDGYSDMSIEEKLAYLENYDFPDQSGNDEAYEKLKKSFDKASSDVAELKKQLKSKMTDEELKSQEMANAINEWKTKFEEVAARENFRNVTNEYMELGYSKELAESSAKAEIEGDRKTLLANRKSFIEGAINNVKAENLKGMGRPDGGSGTTTITKEQFRNMDYEERLKVYSENPELYNKLKE